MTKQSLRRIVAVAVLIWLVIIAVSVGVGVQQANAAVGLLRPYQSAEPKAFLEPKAQSDLQRGSAMLSRSNAALSNPFMQPLRLLPVAGRQLSSAIALTDAAYVLTDIGANALQTVPAVVTSTDRGAALELLADEASEASRRLEKVDLGPEDGLAGPLFDARADLSGPVIALQAASARGGSGLKGLARLYKTEGKYLVVAANSGEMRAGSGMWLSVGVLETGAGGLKLGEMRTVGDLPAVRTAATWPPQYEALWGWLGRRDDYRNLMLSPRFDVSAPLAKGLWENSGGEPVDGVMVIDPLFLESLMKATGPVTVNGDTVESSDVVRQLLVDQYRGLAVTGSTIESQAERRSALSAIARNVFDAIGKPTIDPLALARSLDEASRSRHLLVWAADPASNADWQRAGVSGTLGPNSLSVGSLNVGGNKLDTFVAGQVEYSTQLRNELQYHRMTVTVTNNAPAELPFYVQGPNPASTLVAGEYQGLVTVNLPGDAISVATSGGRLAALGPDGPTQLLASEVRIRRGQSATVVVTFQRPIAAPALQVEPSGRVLPNQWSIGQFRFEDRFTTPLRR